MTDKFEIIEDIRRDMPEEQYFNARDKYKAISNEIIDFILITYANPMVSLKRDYVSSLTLEKRNFLNHLLLYMKS